MGRHLPPLPGLPVLVLVLACAGCAVLTGPRTAPVSQVGGAAAESPGQARSASEPAPALQIAGPAPLSPAGRNDPPSPVLGPPPPAAGSASSASQGIPIAQAPPPQSDGNQALRELYRQAQQRYATVDGYVVRLRRREEVGGKLGAEEVIQLKFRKEPWSVYLRWIGETAKGREVVYVKGQHGNRIHTLTCATDTPLRSLGAGKHFEVAPDDPRVLSRSRYTITDTGVGALIDRFGQILESCERGENRLGTLKYLGRLPRQELDEPAEAVLQSIPPGVERGLPRGGQRFWFFDATNHRFPVLIQTLDDRGGLVELYCYDNFLFPGRLRDDDFDPARLWKR
jgi:hypothetical protein